jgi:hypothetical protein
MNWDAIGAIGEAISAVVVLVTLVYLVIQVRAYKQQAFLTSLQTIYDSLNNFPALIAESESLASIISRGRENYRSLNPVELLRFDQTHVLVLNGFENWLHHVNHAMPKGSFREEHIRNIRESLRTYLNYPGCSELVMKYDLNLHPDMRELVRRSLDGNLGNSPLDRLH